MLAEKLLVMLPVSESWGGGGGAEKGHMPNAAVFIY
jgi:hypothetical protein